MTYITRSLSRETLQKDLYIKKKFSVGVNNTPWIPKVNILITKIVCELKDTASGSGSSVIRIYKNYGTASQETIFDAVFSENQISDETNALFSYSLPAGSEVVYGITSVTSNDPGGEAIISFLYENE